MSNAHIWANLLFFYVLLYGFGKGYFTVFCVTGTVSEEDFESCGSVVGNLYSLIECVVYRRARRKMTYRTFGNFG